MALMTIKQYAEKVGRHRDTVMQKIYRGKLPAMRVGSTWLIDSETPYEDHRTKKYYRESEYYQKRLRKAEQRKQEKEAEKKE